MTIAALFPGHATDIERHIEPWYTSSSSVRHLVDVAAATLGLSVPDVFARGARALRRTEIFQPVQTALVLGIDAELRQAGHHADVIAGHSLGEVAACAAAGCLNAEAAVALAAVRGRLMARAAIEHPGSLAAITAESGADAAAACTAVAGHGTVVIAAHNSTNHWVLSGPVASLRAIPVRYSPRPLPDAGPWHSEALTGVVAEFHRAATDAVCHDAAHLLVSNRTAAPVVHAAAIADALAAQLTQPARWAESLVAMAALGVDCWHIVGPGRALRGFVRETLGAAANIRMIETPADLAALGPVAVS